MCMHVQNKGPLVCISMYLLKMLCMHACMYVYGWMDLCICVRTHVCIYASYIAHTGSIIPISYFTNPRINYVISHHTARINMAEWRSCKEATSRRVVEIYQFFQRYECLADAYSIGVFTEDHWSHVVPDGWKSELAVTSDQLFL